MTTTNTNKKIWLITGVSSGFGRELAEQVVKTGDYVIGTLRNAQQVEAFNAEFSGKAKAVLMDVTKSEQVQAGIEAITAEFGRIDVLVNNAGYGLAGAIEEVSTAEARTQFDTNVFGLLDLTQRVLPTMRAQKSGVIVNLSSLVGHVGMPGIGIYSATKFAVEGISEALAAEVAPLGIRVLLVEPGPYRTKFNGSSLRRAQRTLPDYAGTAHETLKWIDEVDGKQPGDPELAVALMIKTIGDANAPFRLPLGQFAIEGIRRKLASVEADVKTVEQASLATDRPAAEQAA